MIDKHIQLNKITIYSMKKWVRPYTNETTSGINNLCN